jgi:alpha-glucosidase/alpha-D-xyloside xylohydrolase
MKFPGSATGKIAVLLCIFAACVTGYANSSIRYGGSSVELSIGEVSGHTLRIGLSPLDAQGQAEAGIASPLLMPVPLVTNLHIQELSVPKELNVGALRVTVTPEPLSIRVRRADGSLVQELSFGESAETNSVTFRVSEAVLGLGEGADQFDRRGANYPFINGQRYRLAELGARAFSPLVIGTEGWAIFVSAPLGSFDLRGEQGLFHPLSSAPAGHLELFVTDAEKPATAMQEFVRLTGKPVMPPKWALGYIQSHRTLSSEADILAEAQTFRDKNLPCDGFIFLGTGFCPAGWNFGHDSFQFNTNVFTHQPAEVIQALHAQHLHVVLHIVPKQRDYPSLHGQIPPSQDEKPDAQDIGTYWARHHELVAAGVDGWWPDEGDWFDVTSRLERHRMYYEGPLSERPNVRPWDLQRNGCPGIAQYGGWIWSGDISSSWKTFAAQVKVGLNTSLSLTPFWGTDIGGFYPSTNHEYTGELYARWFEFASFCPSFRSHGRTWHLHLPWGWDTGQTGPIESRPAPDPSELHNAQVEPICRKYLDLRYQLMPYTYTITREAHDTGMPLMRALWLHYPHDPEAVKLGDEYLWGRDLLVAPVIEKAAASRRVYLPTGEWFDWWTGEKVAGGRWIERPLDLATMPIYARAGSIIPFDPVRQYTGQSVDEPTTLRVYPGADGSFTMYDDDGQSQGYLDGSDSKTIWLRFRWENGRSRLIVERDERMNTWTSGTRVFNVEMAGTGKSKRVEFRGQPVTIRL